MFVFSLELHSG